MPESCRRNKTIFTHVPQHTLEIMYYGLHVFNQNVDYEILKKKTHITPTLFHIVYVYIFFFLPLTYNIILGLILATIYSLLYTHIFLSDQKLDGKMRKIRFLKKEG